MKLRGKNHWARREKQLAAVIKKWLDQESDGGDWAANDHDPWIGEETYALMARAAISILRATRDIERHFAREGVWERE